MAHSAPDFLGKLHDHAQLRPLFVLGEDIAFLGGGEAALRRPAEPVEIGEFGCLVDAALGSAFISWNSAPVLVVTRPSARCDPPAIFSTARSRRLARCRIP